MSDEPQVVSTGPTARVADGYGINPHEHKPSQDPFAPDVSEEIAEAKQAVSGGRPVDDDVQEKADQPYPDPSEEGGEESSPGSSSSTSETDSESTEPKTGGESTPAQSAENRSVPARKGSSTASSMGTKSSPQSSRKADS